MAKLIQYSKELTINNLKLPILVISNLSTFKIHCIPYGKEVSVPSPADRVCCPPKKEKKVS